MTELVHCIFIAAKSKKKPPLIINFTNAFKIECQADSILAITSTTDSRVAVGLEEAGVAGIAVLYGINGAGKTAAMIDVANAFGNDPRTRTAGGLFERDGKLYLRRGKALQGYSVTGTPGISPVGEEDDLVCLSLFYSSSPFDTGRLGQLRGNRRARDVSPRFGERNAFDGLSLLDIRAALNMPFIDHAEISLRVRVASMSKSLMAVMNKGRTGGNRQIPAVRKAVTAAVGTLSSHEQMQWRCWLSLFVAVHESGNRAFPAKFIELLERFPDSANPLRDLYALWKVAILACHGYMGMPAMTQVMELLQRSSEPALAKLLSKKYLPEQMDSLIKQTFRNDRDGMRQCSDLGLLEFSISKLSSGEMAYAIIFSSLYGGLDRISKSDQEHPVFILLDEGEMFLHPLWQREYIAKLLKFATQIPRLRGRLYFLLSTHSLIVAADAPPYSLIDVATGTQENGFGLGPRSTLTDIYKVKVFHGEYSENEIARIDEFIRNPSLEAYAVVKEVVGGLADRHSREFLESEIDEAQQRSAK